MVKMSFTNNQTAFEYALYMIATSYFRSAVCKNKLLEQNMLLQYKEQKLEKQYQMEEICIRYMDRLIKSLPIATEEQDVQVQLKRNKNNKTVLIIKGINYRLVFVGEYSGKSSKIRCKYITQQLAMGCDKAA